MILCDKPLYRNPTTFIDDWGNEWLEADMMIRGFYYERLSARQRGQVVTYDLLKNKPANAHSYHVICYGSLLLPSFATRGWQRYNMTIETRTELVNVVACRHNNM